METTTEEIMSGIECGNCGKNGGTEELHSCPFSEEVYSDSIENCNCCKDCCYQCSMNV